MFKLISFSLWGNEPKYTFGAIKNVNLAKQWYPEYICRFYCDLLVPNPIKYELEDMGCEIVEMNKVGDFEGMFWRFYAVNEADIVLIRDCDSRISQREKKCVEEWLNSNKKYHSIHDHPAHRFLVMPGLMGFKKSDFNLKEKIEKYHKKNHYGIDYEFFYDIFDEIKENLFIHDEFYGRGKKINHKRENLEFCGKVFDENDVTVKTHEEMLKNILDIKIQ